MKIKTIIFFLLLACSFQNSFSATFHVLILCDTDLWDIGHSVKIDQEKVSNEVEIIAKNLNMVLQKKVFTNDEFNDSIFKYIDSLNVEDNDIVIFYFAGHGFHSKDKSINEPWPDLFLSKTRSIIDYKDIIEALEEKKPKFLLTIADCCNNVIPINFPKINKNHLALRLLSKEMDNYKNLFLNFSGKIFISSASLDEMAFCTTENGGLFTKFFLESLKNRGTHSLNWEDLLSDTVVQLNQKLIKKNLKQTPFFVIDITYDE